MGQVGLLDTLHTWLLFTVGELASRESSVILEAVQKATELVLGRGWKLQRVIDAVKAGVKSSLYELQIRLQRFWTLAIMPL